MRAVGPLADDLVAPVLAWYQENARDLPWRRPGTSPWAVLVSEFMLQQTPVHRVTPAWHSWLDRWPTPAPLAADTPGEAVRQWGRLGYPRRALRLHAAACEITERHAGVVPDSVDELVELPGIGAYTAAAVASFAFGHRHPVLDTNTRRVLARAVAGEAGPGASVTVAERGLASDLLPDDDATAARWAVASMELGALVCTARSPRCEECPLASVCAWRRAGRPENSGTRRRQTYAGTDRQVRGRLLAVLRHADGPVSGDELAGAWDEPVQRERALDSLVADGLVEPLPDATFRLPTSDRQG